jgi:hypothetical protein
MTITKPIEQVIAEAIQAAVVAAAQEILTKQQRAMAEELAKKIDQIVADTAINVSRQFKVSYGEEQMTITVRYEDVRQAANGGKK